MSPADVAVLEAARAEAGLSMQDLWVAYYSLGGISGEAQLAAQLTGSGQMSAAEYDIIAHALNEHFLDKGATTRCPTPRTSRRADPGVVQFRRRFRSSRTDRLAVGRKRVAIHPLHAVPDDPLFAQASTPGLLDVLRHDAPGEITVAVNGEVDLLGHGLLRECLAAALEDASTVTVDLSGTTFMDSTGLNVLIGASRRAAEIGGHLRIRGADARLLKLFEISGARSILNL